MRCSSTPLSPPKLLGLVSTALISPKQEALQAVEDTERETGLPATDVIRFGADKLVDAIQRFRST